MNIDFSDMVFSLPDTLFSSLAKNQAMNRVRSGRFKGKVFIFSEENPKRYFGEAKNKFTEVKIFSHIDVSLVSDLRPLFVKKNL